MRAARRRRAQQAAQSGRDGENRKGDRGKAQDPHGAAFARELEDFGSAAATFDEGNSDEVADMLQQVVFPEESNRKRTSAEVLLHRLLGQWTASSPRPDLYHRAALARLLAMLALHLAEDSAATATEHLLQTLPATNDYLVREAMARTLKALAPKLSGAERERALDFAKRELACTGSTEEAGAVVASLPADRDLFTHGITEVLKYPNTPGEPADVLLTGLRERWPDKDALEGKTTPTEIPVWLRWFNQNLHEGYL